MATTTQDPTEKTEPTELASIDKGTPHGNLTFLAQAAATEHALTPLQAMRTYWRAFLWCMFICVGALLWGYDAQVCIFAYLGRRSSEAGLDDVRTTRSVEAC